MLRFHLRGLRWCCEKLTYNGFMERYEKAKVQLEQLRATKTAREAQAEAIGAHMFEVKELDALTESDEKLWLAIVDTVTVHAGGQMNFKFQGGTEIDAQSLTNTKTAGLTACGFPI